MPTRGIIQSLGTAQGRLLRLELVVLVSALILGALVLHGNVHRRSSVNVLRGVMGVAYSMSYVVVAYAVGLIQDGPYHDETFVLWAAALLVIQASMLSTSEQKVLLVIQSAPGSGGRCQHDCGDLQRKKLLLQHLLQKGLVLWLIVNASSRNPYYRAAIWAFWALNMLKIAGKILEIIWNQRPDMSVKVYMAVEEDLPFGDDPPPDPATMQGYRYIFHGEELMEPVVYDRDGGHPARDNMLSQSAAKSVVTIDQVYQWIDQQPYSDFEKDRAKDFCLAFALFKLLKRRFYGYVPAEAGSDKARGLVLTGLIHAGATGPDAVVRVVEEELASLYDFLYWRNNVLGPKTHICIAVTVAGLTIWTDFFGTLAPTYHRLLIGVHDIARCVMVLVVVIAAGLEVCEAVAGFHSNWRYVKTVYLCVRDDRPWAKRRRSDLWWKETITPPETTRYKIENVGQYVLLKRFRHQP